MTSCTERKSNFELLRIWAMVSITMIHLIVHGLSDGMYTSYNCSNTFLCITKFLQGGVVEFLLISGYFGIKTKISSIYRFYTKCMFYGAIGFIPLAISIINKGETVTLRAIFQNVFLVISHPSGPWFVEPYFYLLLIAPIINTVIQHMNDSEYGMMLIIMFILTEYFGFLQGCSINNNGSSLAFFIFIYCIGGYIKRREQVLFRKSNRKFYILAYFLCAVASIVLEIIGNKLNIDSQLFNTSPRHHPFNIATGICIFLFFGTINIKSKMVNQFATGVFAVYLITENSHISYHIYGNFERYAAELAPMSRIVAVFTMTLILFFAGISLDYLRRTVVKPIDKKIMPVLDKASICINRILSHEKY